MHIFQQGNSLDLKKAWIWWNALEVKWKMAFNEALLRKGPTLEPPKDEELMLLLIRSSAFRFAGPLAPAPNLSFELTNLSGLSELTHLTYLSFTHSNVHSLKEIANLNKLQSLFVYNNKLTSLSGIEGMKELTELYCLQNKIKSIKPVKGLTNLKTLYINYNEIESLEGITNAHSEKLRNFYVEPNERLPHKEIVRVQNEFGIICRMAR